MIKQFMRLQAKVAEIERRLDGLLRFGTVKSVDASKGTVVLEAGVDHDSPDLPYAQAGGALKIHSAPSPGQHMLLLCPGGDLRSGVAIPAGFGGPNVSPSSDGAENVLTFGTVKLTVTGNGVVISVGGTAVNVTSGQVTIDGAAVSFNGPTVEHGGTNIGKDHRHRDTQPGAGLTGIPS